MVVASLGLRLLRLPANSALCVDARRCHAGSDGPNGRGTDALSWPQH